jgi:hypothetical protein
MLDSEEKEYNEILNSLDPKEAVPSDKFKNQLKAKLVKEVNKGQAVFSVADWYLNFLSLILVVISISLVAYFGVLYNTNTGTTTGSSVVLSDLDKEKILEQYTKNNPETLTRRRAAPVVSFAEQKSSNYFKTEKNQTFGNEYFRCTNSFLIVNQTIVEETFYGNNTTLVKEVVTSGVGELVSEKVIRYTGNIKSTEEFRGGEYIAVTTEDNKVNTQNSNTAATVNPVKKDGVEVFEIEYRSFLDCNDVQEQLITVQYINPTTYKVESEEVYIGSKSEDNLYSITTIETTERNITKPEERDIFELNEDVEVKELTNFDMVIKYVIPQSNVDGITYAPANLDSDIVHTNYIDQKFYPDNNWGEDLFEHTVKVLGNPTVTYDIQLSPFEYTKVTISSSLNDSTLPGSIPVVIVINGSRVDAKINQVPVSFSENNQVLTFEFEGYNYRIETTDLELFDNLETYNIL